MFNEETDPCLGSALSVISIEISAVYIIILQAITKRANSVRTYTVTTKTIFYSFYTMHKTLKIVQM